MSLRNSIAMLSEGILPLQVVAGKTLYPAGKGQCYTAHHWEVYNEVVLAEWDGQAKYYLHIHNNGLFGREFSVLELNRQPVKILSVAVDKKLEEQVKEIDVKIAALTNKRAALLKSSVGGIEEKEQNAGHETVKIMK